MPIDQIKPNPGNPKTHPRKQILQIANSIIVELNTVIPDFEGLIQENGYSSDQI